MVHLGWWFTIYQSIHCTTECIPRATPRNGASGLLDSQTSRSICAGQVYRPELPYSQQTVACSSLSAGACILLQFSHLHTACLPRSQGGLGLIHPQLQQCALQLRWLLPLLCQSTALLLSSPSIVLPRLVGFLLSQHPSSSLLYRSPPQQLDHRFSLLFPCRRPSSLRHTESSWSLLFKAIDRLPKDFSSTVVSASTCLEIPLASVILPSSSSVELGRSLAQLPSAVAYIMGSDRDSCLRPRRSAEFSCHPNLAKKFLKWIKRDDVQLSPFFVRAFIHSSFSSFGHFPFLQVEDHTVVDITPFVESLSICSSSGSGQRRPASSTKAYRKLCCPQAVTKPPLPIPYNPDIQAA
ncbi:hypothetical protein [Parasitella parasitica]|uniref:Uncharacterized protein n=1 Tax=Parasitella parasitica TaxID=35722 RepID=A0A0B7N9Y1_9FUNG|nr:hypothetical protein [Parasitella parasitica]